MEEVLEEEEEEEGVRVECWKSSQSEKLEEFNESKSDEERSDEEKDLDSNGSNFTIEFNGDHVTVPLEVDPFSWFHPNPSNREPVSIQS